MKHFLLIFLLIPAFTHAQRAYKAPEVPLGWHLPSPQPDHIVLNFTENPATEMSVTWRTDTTVSTAYAEIAPATAAPKFWRNAQTLEAKTELMDASAVKSAYTKAHYHSVTFTGLEPATLYAYRVGDGTHWSEWIQFTTAQAEEAPFSFLYVGDAQNYILELWSRLIREGYRKAPDASFIIHAGDLVTDAHSERQWQEWFTAGGWIHRMLPSIPTPGNHEYEGYTEEEEDNDISHLSVQWQPQFTLPQNGPAGAEWDAYDETVYYVDYQGTRIISLNSSRLQEEQVAWVENVLENNPNTWTVVTAHHPMFSASEGRNNKKLRSLWKPVFDKYRVDLVLQGHDHSYARGRTFPGKNQMAGLNMRDVSGTMYVVSVSGGKMYTLDPRRWENFDARQDRGAENTQLFQLVNVNYDTLVYESYTATGELYDRFRLVKGKNGAPNSFTDLQQEAISERRHGNTIPYEDELPEAMRTNIMNKYNGYEFDGIRYVNDPDFQGYYVELEKGEKEINLKLSMQGAILSEVVEEE